MEDAANSQRAIVFFLWKEGTPAADIVHRLKNVFGGLAMQKTAVYKWLQRFETGRQSLEDDPRSGRPATPFTHENVRRVEEIVLGDRRVTIREVTCKTGIAATQIHEIINSQLQMSKLTARWVPRLLSAAQKDVRVKACQEL